MTAIVPTFAASLTTVLDSDAVGLARSAPRRAHCAGSDCGRCLFRWSCPPLPVAMAGTRAKLRMPATSGWAIAYAQ
ncbi:hypothetical protein ACFYWU_09090 [Streptomyces chrestomyceticus]|uniref:hypothetical protein n=1 Tax=Streptomyces chrestomyceticus TaxID=68185 RepID=UPI0036B5BCFE